MFSKNKNKVIDEFRTQKIKEASTTFEKEFDGHLIYVTFHNSPSKKEVKKGQVTKEAEEDFYLLGICEGHLLSYRKKTNKEFRGQLPPEQEKFSFFLVFKDSHNDGVMEIALDNKEDWENLKRNYKTEQLADVQARALYKKTRTKH